MLGQGVSYEDCTTAENGGVPWCATAVDSRYNYRDGLWGNCAENCRLSLMGGWEIIILRCNVSINGQFLFC